MNDPASASPLASLAFTPANHFRLRFFETIAQLREAWPTAEEELPFLAGYYAELDAAGRLTPAAIGRFRRQWERASRTTLPLVELADRAQLDDHALSVLFAVGLVDEDQRFGALLEALQGPGRTRPTPGLLDGWIPGGDVRRAVPRLVALGLVDAANHDDPRANWQLQVPGIVWDALRGDGIELASRHLRWQPADSLTPLDDLILDEDLSATVAGVPSLLAGETVSCTTIRGPAASGRRTVAGAVARELGRGLLELCSPRADDPLLRTIAPLAILLRALPVVALELGPGEMFGLPDPLGFLLPLIVTLGNHGGLEGPCMDRAVGLTLSMPGSAERRLHWEQALATPLPAALAGVCERSRMTGGNIRRVATLARAEAALAGRGTLAPSDVRRAARTRSGQLLDNLAERVATTEEWDALAVSEETRDELLLLERRCRHRERLHDGVGPRLRGELGAGVRALFTGPSGTGKTLAARTLAGVLDVDLYRLDLSMVVNKYIGETEKNLSRVFARAEEADIALLLDEGDSLLTRRTSVESSHDRYANLETNYLLQRLESFEGILIVTTNAGDRIDPAFRRRMDVVIDFYPPTPLERWSIWSLHLPDQHAVSDSRLEQISGRCALTGGQIRNAVLHAAVLALDDDRGIDERDLLSAIQREYRKVGQVFPFPEVVGG